MTIKHEEVVEAVLYPEFTQAGHQLRLVSVQGGFPEVQIRVNGFWWPVDRVIDA